MATNQLNQQKCMVDHLRDMFNFDDEIIESILIQREWNVDRALDDLMALTHGCTFNIPVDNFDGPEENPMVPYNEFVNNGPSAAVFVAEDGDDEYMKNGSEDDVIVLNQEEYCLSAGSESEEEAASAVAADANSQPSIPPAAGLAAKLSYADAARPVAPVAPPARVKPPHIVYQGYTSYDQIKRTRDSLERVKLFVKEGFKIMVLMRGCPGSGKSFLARKLIGECGIAGNIYQHVHSSDNFFRLNGTGQYRFDFEKLSEAHRWNEANVLHVAREGLTPIVIDNTNTQMWEMCVYARIAVYAGYEIEVMEPDTPWAFTVHELVRKNQHNVPGHSIVKMMERYEHNVSALSLLKSFSLEYADDRKPPQMGILQLSNPHLVAVFQNIYHTIHVLGSQHAKPKMTKASKKKMTKAEKKAAKALKKQQKLEKRLKKMVEEVRLEDSESNDEGENSNESCIRDGDVETINAFLSTDLKEKGTDSELPADDDACSETSWTTIDTHDDYDDNNSSDNEEESNSMADLSESSSSSSVEACSTTSDNQSTPKSSTKRVKKSSGVTKKARKAHTSVENTDNTMDDVQNSKVITANMEVAKKLEFSEQLYDALAKNGSRLKCFENMRTGDKSSSEHSKDDTFENISPELEKFDLESERPLESHPVADNLETSDVILVDLNEQNMTSMPATNDDILLNDEDGELVQTEAKNGEMLARLEQCMSDSMQNDETSLNLEVAQLTDNIIGAQNNPPKCEWVGLENCVNLPSNVRIEKKVEVPDLLPVSVERSTDLSNAVKEPNDQSLNICDVIPSFLINEVVESSVVISLDDQLKETISIPTVKNWTPDGWLCDASLEQSTNTNLPSLTKNDHSITFLEGDDNDDGVIFDVKRRKTSLTATDSEEVPDQNEDGLENVEAVQVHPNLPEESNLGSVNEIYGHISVEAANDTDATLSEVIENANLQPEVIDLLESPLTDSKVVSDVPPINQLKGTSLTSAIKNWLYSNPLNEAKNNVGVLTPQEPPRKMSFSSAIKNWVSGTSRNEVKSNEDVPDSPSAASNLSPSSVTLENQCRLSSSPAAKNLADDSPSKLKLECKSPIRVIKNKLCNVETEICNEADILQTMLRQEMQNKKRNDNGVNVDDVNVGSKFNRDAESGGVAGTNVVKNILDGPYENVNLFGEWNQVEKNQVEHSAVENEADSENSDAGSNSSSSDEIRTITDVHNSVNRFVNNDINRDVVVERKKPDVNQEAGNKQLKNSNIASSTASEGEGDSNWSINASMPELNTLKERILINSLDKVFGQNNLELDAAAASVDVDADSKPTNKSPTSDGFHMIENKLRTETGGNAEAISVLESAAVEEEHEVSFWNQWIRGEGWDEKPAAEAAFADKTESKPPRKIRDSSPAPAVRSSLKNSDTSSCWLVNDIKNCMDLEKNQQKLPKTSNFLSSGDPFLQAKELREFVDDQKTAAAMKLQNHSPNYDFLDERTDESKNLQRLSSQFSDVFLSGRRKHSDAESSLSSKWDHPSGGDSKSFNFADSALRTSPNRKPQPEPQPRVSPTASVGKVVNNADELSRWKFSSHVDYSTNSSNYWPKSTVKAVPTFEKEFSLDEAKFERKQKPSEFGNFFIPPEVLHLGQNKATNTGASDVNGYDRHLVGRCREINGRGGAANEEDLSPIEAYYRSDKSTMTEGNAYTVKAKPQRDDLLNMFPREMADAILDLYEKCNGNMDWIIEILMEDGYSPSDDQLEYLSSLQNVVEYRKPADGSPLKEKVSVEKKKNRWRNRNRKNESRQMALKNKRLENMESKPNALPDTVTEDLVRPTEQSVGSAKENEEENLLGATMYEDTFDDSTECVDLFIDWTTVSQLIKYFGNPTVYPIEDYQPVIKLPVSLARHLHAHLIESVIDQAEKNESLMDQLNSEMNAVPAVETNSHELTQVDLADVERLFPDYLVDGKVTTQFVEENGDVCRTHEAEPVARNEDSFASTFSLNLLRKAFPTMDSSFVKETFRSQNFNYFKTKSILSQYKDEIPVVNLEEAPVGLTENEFDEDNFSHNEIRLFDSSVIKSLSRKEILSQVQKHRDDGANYMIQWKRCAEKLNLALRDKKFGVASHCRQVMEEFKQKYEGCNAQAASLLITSCCFQNDDIIDLHFFKVVEALRALDIFLDHHITRLGSSGRQKAVLYVITGRGSRSADGVSHLQPAIKQRLKQREIEFCVESTNTGLVKVVIRKTTVLSEELRKTVG